MLYVCTCIHVLVHCTGQFSGQHTIDNTAIRNVSGFVENKLLCSNFMI